MAKITWQKIDHFTGQPYKRNNASGWHIVDYIADDLRITEQSNGDRILTKGGKTVGTFKTLKAAKAHAETL